MCVTLIHQVHWAVFYRLTAVPFVHVVTSFECFGKFAGFPRIPVLETVGLELESLCDPCRCERSHVTHSLLAGALRLSNERHSMRCRVADFRSSLPSRRPPSFPYQMRCRTYRSRCIIFSNSHSLSSSLSLSAMQPLLHQSLPPPPPPPPMLSWPRSHTILTPSAATPSQLHSVSLP